MAGSLSWKAIVTFRASFAEVIGTLGSLGKRFYAAHKDPMLPSIPETWVVICLPVQDWTVATVNTILVKTAFQCKHLKTCVCWRVKPNESRKKAGRNKGSHCSPLLSTDAVWQHLQKLLVKDIVWRVVCFVSESTDKNMFGTFIH